ncbi:glyceraldehyde-3-phosphate dehydrogenase 1 [Jeotgalicoccus coquinae]|uniref:Glyceraldehyde-3-phosphate dehydrogenase n=1 Tax=Jeotgalicoccus coquinae TaxID=709509 RepID=A0A6V7RA50_9STAP|nr:type I glyceraldehyde-3-phosphate dehydrogenase [Jeotgalicoccus coquinae]MBB6422752.1 glyceraldehyde 3-phosphate dehydrogenase [Jeotgalicoccus coquinae]GGE13387.1 glyceraldehyde-3-phosphate dehydrogenase 1 [Jeotgalicoccus coquinae]CAD2074359.1 Glyceraldehyde-3-phosphate dehydrogenase 1 [Jeotgalicoccus coquinae]
MVRVAINGFGRIGRLAAREIQNYEDMEVVAVNDLTDDDFLAHLFKYDSTQGRFDGDIEVLENGFKINDREVKSFTEKDPANLPWGDLDIDIVLECTGFFTDEKDAGKHLDAGAKKVLISAPGKGDMKTIVYGVNENTLDGSEKIVSAASCTTNCLAPVVKVLNDEFGIKQGLMTTIHAYTGDQNTLDAPHAKGDYRRARAAAENIVPNSTGAAKAIGLVLPELKGKLDGGAQRVPVATGSLTEVTVTLDKKVSAEEVNTAMKNAANPSFGYNEDEIVSTDIIGIKEGSLFDATQTRVLEVDGNQLVRAVAWYDNEMSYTAQLVRTLNHLVTQ